MIQRRVVVSGDVQDVGFRAATIREVAKHASVKGYVRNLSDGRVEAVFAGNENDVLALVAWCRTGPPTSVVGRLEVIEESVNSSLKAFEMRR